MQSYHTSVLESTRYPTHVLSVAATDGDAAGQVGAERGFGEVRYSLSGESARAFVVDPLSGSIRVAPNATLDRERQAQMKLLVVAADTPDGGAAQRRNQVGRHHNAQRHSRATAAQARPSPLSDQAGPHLPTHAGRCP